MRSCLFRLRYAALALASGGLFVFNGCGLSDQQLATVWQSVLTTALNTVVTSTVTGAVGAAGA